MSISTSPISPTTSPAADITAAWFAAWEKLTPMERRLKHLESMNRTWAKAGLPLSGRLATKREAMALLGAVRDEPFKHRSRVLVDASGKGVGCWKDGIVRDWRIDEANYAIQAAARKSK
jgi:hypothetical protein